MEAMQESTIPKAEPTGETAEVRDTSAAPQAEVEKAEQSDEKEITDNTAENGSEGDLFPITVNHTTENLSRDEVMKYAQLGKRSEYLEPFIAKLDYLASVNGVSREDYIEKQIEAYEANMRSDIISRFGDDEGTVNDMLEFTRQKHKKAYENMIAQRNKAELDEKENTETRLAEEFASLITEFPELEGKQFKDLPTEVKKAGFSGEKLINAYLYHKHTEGKKIAEALKTREEQGKASTGSMGADINEKLTEDEKNFLKGLWGK